LALPPEVLFRRISTARQIEFKSKGSREKKLKKQLVLFYPITRFSHGLWRHTGDCLYAGTAHP
jgi:hypothetical protein